MPANETFAQRFERALVLRNIKAADFARMSGVGGGTLSNYLLGKYVPKADKLAKFAEILNVSEIWLLGYGDNEPEEQSRAYADANNPELKFESSVESKIAHLMDGLSTDSVLDSEKMKPEAVLALRSALTTGLAMARDIQKGVK